MEGLQKAVTGNGIVLRKMDWRRFFGRQWPWAPPPSPGWVDTGGDFTLWVQGAPGFTGDSRNQLEQSRSAKSLSWLKELQAPPLWHCPKSKPNAGFQPDSWSHVGLQEMVKDSSIRRDGARPAALWSRALRPKRLPAHSHFPGKGQGAGPSRRSPGHPFPPLLPQSHNLITKFLPTPVPTPQASRAKEMPSPTLPPVISTQAHGNITVS